MKELQFMPYFADFCKFSPCREELQEESLTSEKSGFAFGSMTAASPVSQSEIYSCRLFAVFEN
jgi:hypothetical protein